MSNIPRSLTDSSLALFSLAISASDPAFLSLLLLIALVVHLRTLFFPLRPSFLICAPTFFFNMGFAAGGDSNSNGNGNGQNNHHHHQKHHHLINFHIHLPHIHFLHHHHHEKKEGLKDIPKGCLAIMVGQGEEQQRFVIPVIYINHPLFMQLLKQAEEEYGFDQKGPITIPCHVEQFRTVQGIIDRENPHHHHTWCFRA